MELGIPPIGALGVSLFISDLYFVNTLWTAVIASPLSLSEFLTLKILETTKVPIIPMALKGLWGGLFTRKKDGRRSLFRKNIELEVGEAMSPTHFRMIDLENQIRSMLGEKPITTIANP